MGACAPLPYHVSFAPVGYVWQKLHDPNNTRPRENHYENLQAFSAGTRSNKCGQYREWCARHGGIYFRRDATKPLGHKISSSRDSAAAVLDTTQRTPSSSNTKQQFIH
ncbi:hypothetical protein YC2023_017495 [Brassica napus]